MPRGLPLLVLETDEPLQRLLRTVLRRDGYEPVFVTDGQGALRELDHERFAAFIVDISIAPSTLERGARRGVGFIHSLQRKNPALLSRVVIVTGLPLRDLPRDLPPVRRILRKPFDLDELRLAIAECSAAAA